MDFQESEELLKENEVKHRRKRVLLFGIVICILFVAFLAAVIFYLQIQDAKTFKLFVNSKKVNVSKNFVYVEENKKDKNNIYYVNLEELCKAMGFTYQAGSIAFAEGDNLYSITTNYEKIDLNVDKMTFDKYPYLDGPIVESRKQAETQAFGAELTIRTPKDTKEIFQLNNPLKLMNSSVYVSSADLKSMLSIDYTWNDVYRLYLYTISSTYKRYAPIATKNGYSSLSADYENIRAMVDGFLVVEKNGKYGVINLKGDPIIEAKYDRLLYSQNAKEFFAFAGSKAGLIDKEGKQLIKLASYQEISILDQNLDQEHRLYKVTKDGKYGVVTRNGEELIHTGYDQIGLDKSVELYSDLEDSIILYDKIIPVKQDNGWGYYNIETGELGGYDEVSGKFNYAGIGCDISSSRTSSNQKSVVLIPKDVGIRGVVLMYQSGLYGIYDCNSDRISVTCMWTKIYEEKNSKTGEINYYLDLNGDKTDLRQFLEENGLITETEEETQPVDTTEEESLTEKMNNLSTEGRLGDTSDEDEQYFENINDDNTEENTDENEEGNTQDATADEAIDERNEEETTEESTSESQQEEDEFEVY